MPRQRDPRRDEAFEIFKKHNGSIQNREIANLLGLPEKTIGGWKSKDKWNDELIGVLQTKERSTPKKSGAPKGNKNAKGNRGGSAPRGNSNAVTHGFFRTIFPDDEETHSIIEAIENKSPIDMLWENIVIQYTAIARAQKVMFVTGKDEMIKELKKAKYEYFEKPKDQGGGVEKQVSEEEYEFQFAWDRQATFLQAQSRAITTLQSLIRQYEDMIRQGHADEEQQLRLQKLKMEVRNMSGETDEDAHKQNSGYVEALNGQVEDVFADDGEDDDG